MKFILGLLLGAGITALIFYKRPIPQSAVPEEIVSKLKNLSENEARRYAEATTADEKLKAADALYGKMMIIFLADLALKLQPIHQVDPVMLEQTMKEPAQVVESTSGAPTTTPIATAPAQPEKPKDNQSPLVKLQTSYRNSNHSKTLDRRTRRMMGVFEGTLRHTQGQERGRVDSVVISMDFVQVKKETLDGSSTVILTDPTGKEYSRGSSNGGNGSLRLHPDDEDVVFIDASPTSYISLSVSKLRGTFVDEGKIIGNVQLRRK